MLKLSPPQNPLRGLHHLPPHLLGGQIMQLARIQTRSLTAVEPRLFGTVAPSLAQKPLDRTL